MHTRIQRAIDSLANNPRRRGSVRIVGTNDQWRIRVGDYRVLYTVDDEARQVIVLRVGHRRDVYRR